RITYEECSYDPDPEYGPETDGPQQEEDEDVDEYWDRRQEWIRNTRKVVLPEPGPFNPLSLEERGREVYEDSTGKLKPAYSVDIFRDYTEMGLQVIVKLANIHLTPEKPSYEGGTWHVEGQLVCFYLFRESVLSYYLALLL
ncbi:hypothetical protein H0H87_001322, partial [Tephrocybe sp. NHM501043]